MLSVRQVCRFKKEHPKDKSQLTWAMKQVILETLHICKMDQVWLKPDLTIVTINQITPKKWSMSASKVLELRRKWPTHIPSSTPSKIHLPRMESFKHSLHQFLISLEPIKVSYQADKTLQTSLIIQWYWSNHFIWKMIRLVLAQLNWSQLNNKAFIIESIISIGMLINLRSSLRLKYQTRVLVRIHQALCFGLFKVFL